MKQLPEFLLSALSLSAVLFLIYVVVHFSSGLWLSEGSPADSELLYRGGRALLLGFAIAGFNKFIVKKKDSGKAKSSVY